MITVAILTVSDSAVNGSRADASGPALRVICEEWNWEVTASTVIGDVENQIAAQLIEWADSSKAGLILTTGGTGVALRDVTPEATRLVITREIPGISEWMRTKGLEQTPFAVLSRAIAGVRGQSMIVNLPGSPKGAVHSLRSIKHLVEHVTELLHGRTDHDTNAKLKQAIETRED